jgi:hypothetical protein
MISPRRGQRAKNPSTPFHQMNPLVRVFSTENNENTRTVILPHTIPVRRAVVEMLSPYPPVGAEKHLVRRCAITLERTESSSVPPLPEGFRKEPVSLYDGHWDDFVRCIDFYSISAVETLPGAPHHLDFSKHVDGPFCTPLIPQTGKSCLPYQ